MIKVNKAKCLKCGDVIESSHRHDFVTCSCGNLSVDGGHDYLKRGFKSSEWEDMSVVTSRLRDLLDDRSINAKSFAEKSGIKVSTMYSIMNSQVENIGIENFKKIADGLGMTIDELYAEIMY